MIKPTDARRDAAEALAIQAIAFLADDQERLEQFIRETGMMPDTIRERGVDPELLAAIMDYVIAHDDRLMNFATFAEVKPATVIAARRALPGVNPDW